MSNDARERFIDEVSRQLTPWGVPAAAARLYAYLLLSPEPASLDQIAADLQVSKSTASVSARLLEQYMLARRLGVRGSKRVLYEASDNYENMLVAQNRLLDSLADLFDSGSEAADGRARERLAEVADFYRLTRQGMEQALETWRSSRRPRQDAG
jgi:DNA-binding transcriptional regulator GbsR (MarR family)